MSPAELVSAADAIALLERRMMRLADQAARYEAAKDHARADMLDEWYEAAAAEVALRRSRLEGGE